MARRRTRGLHRRNLFAMGVRVYESREHIASLFQRKGNAYAFRKRLLRFVFLIDFQRTQWSIKSTISLLPNGRTGSDWRGREGNALIEVWKTQ